ncbi:MAG TPA: LptF/LptG family permease [Chryseolinea sp.]|nr:LptF/LptG family permease [Chryseolinea sp.]
MKKIDKLILDAFIGPFLITFLVVVFILLNINMLKYFDDIIGKGLDSWVLGQLFFYFAIFTVPTAMPLAVLLSSLIAFGNLGEHFELTAIKSAGISLLRILRPIFFFVLLLTGAAFYANNNLVPKAALQAYSLLYDIKQKKPALELREGSFYRGIDNLSIKVNQKFPKDQQALKGIIVYDHRDNDGNKKVTIADSGRMYTILGERYLKFELYNGYNYIEGTGNERGVAGAGKPSTGMKESLSRSKFSKEQVVFDLSSFQLQTTDKKWFQGNRIMRNLHELNGDLDSLKHEILNQELNYYLTKPDYFAFYMKEDSLVMPLPIYKQKLYRDSVARLPYEMRAHGPAKTLGGPNKNDSTKKALVKKDSTRKSSANGGGAVKIRGGKIKKDSVIKPRPDPSEALRKAAMPHTSAAIQKDTAVQRKPSRVYPFDAKSLAAVDSLFNMKPTRDMFQGAANTARSLNSQVSNSIVNIDSYEAEMIIFDIQWHKILASSFACIAMFLIGAPLGAIIKKGGLGVPFLVSILFFIIYYVVSMQGEKLAKQATVAVPVGVWLSDVLLFGAGLFFLRQARIDARFFEADFYSVTLDKLKRRFRALAKARKPVPA